MISKPPQTDFTLELRLKELALQELQLQDRQEERLLKEKQMHLEHERFLKELELKHAAVSRPSHVELSAFDAAKNIRLVPPFVEKDVEKYFPHFERVATLSKWPEHAWTLLLQSVLVGKAQEAYSALSIEQSTNYETVKEAILRAYELVPEAYRQRFRSLNKLDGQTYLDFAKEKETLFNRWCKSQKAETKEDLKQLILLEEFKNCLPNSICTYINEQQVSTLDRAAVLADEFSLTHKTVFDKQGEQKGRALFNRPSFSKPASSYASFTSKPTVGGTSVKACFYCKKPGHLIADCPVLSKKPTQKKELAGSSAFLMDGFVSLESDPSNRQPVKIWRDSGAFQSLILKDVLQFTEESALGSSVLVEGFGGGYLSCPLHNIDLQTALVSGKVVVAICPYLPIDGVSFILGNDLAGGRVLTAPEVVSFPVAIKSPDELEEKFPDTFPVCVTTRAMFRKDLGKESDPEISLSDTFLVKLETPGFGKVFPSREELKLEQEKDATLSYCFGEAISEDELKAVSCGYFVNDGVLMRKWTSPKMSCQDDWSSVFQIVVPSAYRPDILHLAHDHCLAGHMGVRKTLDRVMRHFFWPGVKNDVAQHCKTCHVCQIVGKPNQKIPPAPLHPIPAIGEPFEHILIDCVGPLPRTKSGNQYLLTIMCMATRYPEAIPLRRITASAVSKALIKFFTVFGLPRVVQTDQGSNFMSSVFSQVLKQLSIQHRTSSAYHPESQGALERFHQTLKTMLRAYCKEFEKDWDDGTPLLLFAAREVTQESLGFSPAELVFGHTVRGPLKMLKEKWLENQSAPTNLLDFVCDFRSKLTSACDLAKRNLKQAQVKMKGWYDRKARHRVFSPGDRVLVLLPLTGSALQAQYSGPYVIDRQVGKCDYLVKTPDRKRKTRLCHVNLLKPYCGRNQPIVADVKTVAVVNTLTHVGEDTNVVIVPEGSDVVSDDLKFTGLEFSQGRLPNSKVLNNLDFHLSYLDSPKRSDITELIYKHLALFSDVPTRTNVLQHDIDVGDAAPIKQHPYRVNPVKQQILRKEVDYMLQHGIAEPSTSSWSSPCLLVEKSDHTPRFCTDFRKVNSVTKPDCYPLPRLDDCIDRVGSAGFVTKLDLLKGYWQVPLTERACEISAFVTPDDFCQYTVMAFGMRNAPATFQRLVNKVLKGVAGCEAYLDDVVIFSSSWFQHVAQLEEVFHRFAVANLTLNLAKCEFGQATITYLGKIVGCGMVCPVEAKVEAIVNFGVPGSRRDLKRFLGMAGYYRSFCRNFATVAAPLTNLLSPKVPFVWTDVCQFAFESLKALLANSPVLVAPDFSRPFKLAVDASDVGVGAVLLQEDSLGVEHPVCYFSRKFNLHQKHYSTVEKEALALILALDHFGVYVSTSQTLVVYTDHNPLVFLNRMKNSNHRLMRWSLVLQEFNLDIQHVRGKDNVLADALSRS
ncbi:uncharacterized protein LOC109142602 [Larimichthys crocea]|uniref:uncharacterized protein LOC109142602 n=1 Tax=Larimichthys crocea TaxID=215358 RepID=UPI000F5FBD94|nr:uncharacterized protein LOC109142602 [Larimichthys crocea]